MSKRDRHQVYGPAHLLSSLLNKSVYGLRVSIWSSVNFCAKPDLRQDVRLARFKVDNDMFRVMRKHERVYQIPCIFKQKNN